MGEVVGQVLGWSGNLFLIVAFILIGRKWRHAFLGTFTGEVLWLVEGIRMDRWDIAIQCGVFAVIALFNWWSWTHTTIGDDENGSAG